MKYLLVLALMAVSLTVGCMALGPDDTQEHFRELFPPHLGQPFGW